MANNRFNRQIQTVPEKTSGGRGVFPMKGEPQKSDLPMETAGYPGLPGPAQRRDRSLGVPEEKVYASAQGLRGGADADPGPSGGPSHNDF